MASTVDIPMVERILNQSWDELAEAIYGTTQAKLEFSGPPQPWHFKLSQNVVAFVLDVLNGTNSRTITFPQLYNISPDLQMENAFSGSTGYFNSFVENQKYPCTPSDYEAILAELNAIKGTCFTCELLPKPNGQPSIRLNFLGLNDTCPRFQAIFDARKKEVTSDLEHRETRRLKYRDETTERFLNTAVRYVTSWDKIFPQWSKGLFGTRRKEFDLTDGVHGKPEDLEYWTHILNQKSDGLFICRFLNNEWSLEAERYGSIWTRFVPTRRTGIRCRIIE